MKQKYIKLTQGGRNENVGGANQKDVVKIECIKAACLRAKETQIN